MDIDRSLASSMIRSVAIETEVKRALDELDAKDTEHHLDHSLKLAGEKFHLHDLSKLEYGFKDTRNYSRKTQTWQGYVLEVNNDKFTAKVEDLSNPGGTYEIVKFDVEEVSPGDRNLLQLGSIFYWSIGSSIINGQIKKESILRFKRVAKWSETDYDKAADFADTLYKSIKWE